MNFHYIFPNYKKLKSFGETYTPCNQQRIFMEQMSNMDFYIWYWPGPN